VQKWSYGATTGETVAGNSNGTAGSGPNELNSPKGIALDKDDNLYVADYTNLRIQKFEVL
jgi:DNA-binding beta-propeller fold protein YncE